MAPSDMMDGRIAAIKQALISNDLGNKVSQGLCVPQAGASSMGGCSTAGQGKGQEGQTLPGATGTALPGTHRRECPWLQGNAQAW